MTTPYPEGPGLPRAPPSLKATRCCSGGFSRALKSSLVARDEEYESMRKFTLRAVTLPRSAQLGPFDFAQGKLTRRPSSIILNSGRTIQSGARLHRAGVRAGGIRVLRRDRLRVAF